MKYVIVDDEEVNLMIGKRMLLQVLDQADISTFNKGEEALMYFKNDLNYKTHRYVILFLDLNMPIMSGWDFLKLLERCSDNLKAILHVYILSSSIDPRDESKALSSPNVVS